MTKRQGPGRRSARAVEMDVNARPGPSGALPGGCATSSERVRGGVHGWIEQRFESASGRWDPASEAVLPRQARAHHLSPIEFVYIPERKGARLMRVSLQVLRDPPSACRLLRREATA